MYCIVYFKGHSEFKYLFQGPQWLDYLFQGNSVCQGTCPGVILNKGVLGPTAVRWSLAGTSRQWMNWGWAGLCKQQSSMCSLVSVTPIEVNRSYGNSIARYAVSVTPKFMLCYTVSISLFTSVSGKEPAKHSKLGCFRNPSHLSFQSPPRCNGKQLPHQVGQGLE